MLTRVGWAFGAFPGKCFQVDRAPEKRKVDSPISIVALDGRLLARGDFSVMADRGSVVRDVHLFLVRHHAFPAIAPQHNRAATPPRTFASDCDFCDHLHVPDGPTDVPDMTLASHIFLYALPLSAVLTIGCVFVIFPEPRPWTTAPIYIWLVSLVTTLMIVCRLLTRSKGKHLRWDLKNYSQAFWTLGAYLAGLVVATAVRLARGPLHLGDFYQAGVPVIAGFVVAIVFQQTRASDIGKAGIRAREVTVVYVLTGAVCPMFGLFSGHGFSYLVFYAAICGSLGSSCYALVQAALHPAPPDPSPPAEGRSRLR